MYYKYHNAEDVIAKLEENKIHYEKAVEAWRNVKISKKKDGSDDREGVKYADLQEVHNHINEALKAWHRATGCTLK